MRRATLRMTLESSTTRQVFIATPLLCITRQPRAVLTLCAASHLPRPCPKFVVPIRRRRRPSRGRSPATDRSRQVAISACARFRASQEDDKYYLREWFRFGCSNPSNNRGRDEKPSPRWASCQKPASARSDDDGVALCLDGHREPAMSRQQSGIEQLDRVRVHGPARRAAGEQ